MDLVLLHETTDGALETVVGALGVRGGGGGGVDREASFARGGDGSDGSTFDFEEEGFNHFDRPPSRRGVRDPAETLERAFDLQMGRRGKVKSARVLKESRGESEGTDLLKLFLPILVSSGVEEVDEEDDS